MHFSEIIKFQFWKNCFVFHNFSGLLLLTRWLPLRNVWLRIGFPEIALANIYFPRISHKLRKNTGTSLRVGTVLKANKKKEIKEL